MKKTIIEFEKIENDNYKITFSGDAKKMSAQRFVALLGFKRRKRDSDYEHNKELLLDFYDLNDIPPKETLGEMLEEPLLDYYYHSVPYITYPFKSVEGNAFQDGVNNDYNGLPDALIPSLNTIVECKTTLRFFKGYEEKWKKQVQFYGYNWNKYMADTEKIKIEKLEIIKYYIKDFEWQSKYIDNIVPEFIEKFEIPLENDIIEQDIKKATIKMKSILNSPYLVINLKKSNFLWKAINRKRYGRKIILKYDSNDKRIVEEIKSRIIV